MDYSFINQVVDVTMADKDDDIDIIIEDQLMGFPLGDGLKDEIKQLIKKVSKEIMIPNFVELTE